MNTINFNQVGGFPLTTDILAKLQSAFSVFNALGAISGEKTIISGCETTGSIASDGVVYVNGEVFDFKGGTIQTKVKIVEVIGNLFFEDGSSKPTIKTRYVTFGTGVGAMDWADFARGIQTKELQGLFLGINDSLFNIITKLNTIDEDADVSLQPDYEQTDTSKKDYIKNKPAGTILHKGTYPIGDPTGSDDLRTITFPTVGTTNYMVFGTLISKGDVGYDNDMSFVIKDTRTATSFVIGLRDGGTPSQIQNLEFDFILIAK